VLLLDFHRREMGESVFSLLGMIEGEPTEPELR
jgi:hypothetical protein